MFYKNVSFKGYVYKLARFGGGLVEFTLTIMEGGNEHTLTYNFYRVYVTDSSNNRVQVFTSDGEYIEQFGYFSGNDDGFFSPQGITVSGNKIYVVDALLNRITVFNQQ